MGRYHANFYSGTPENFNTIDRFIYSEAYGETIRNNLADFYTYPTQQKTCNYSYER